MILMAQILQAPATSWLLQRVAASVLIGTTIERSDFMLYGSAAAPVTGTLLAFSTFAACSRRMRPSALGPRFCWF